MILCLCFSYLVQQIAKFNRACQLHIWAVNRIAAWNIIKPTKTYHRVKELKKQENNHSYYHRSVAQIIKKQQKLPVEDTLQHL